ncbi:MAG TPA: glycoside hydrolase family 9 protein [Ilumatobacteraceae bacterium]|nr:glycoside hydrolase family 9 protein [Ilumatobacteraceae bacterium]
MTLRKIPLRKFVPTTSLALSIALVAAGSLTAPAIAADGENVRNGDFSNGTDQWFTTGNLAPTIVDGRLCVDVPGGTVNPWDAIVGQNDLALEQGVFHRFSYDVSSSVDGKNARALVGLSVDPFTAYFTSNELLTTTTTSSSNTYEQPATTDQAQVAFQLGGSPDPWTFCVDNVSLTAGGENVRNGDFAAGSDQWFTTGNLTPTIVDGRLCVDVPGGTSNPWDAIVGQNDIALEQGVTYRFSYDVSSSVEGKNARALVGLSVDPFTAYFTSNELLSTTTTSSSNTFEQPATTPQGQVAFQLGGSPDPWTFCVDNVSLLGGSAPEPYVPDTGPRVRVNQVGYLPNGPKGATLVTDATVALVWELKSASGTVVRSGTTQPGGVDVTSGLNVHEIDFSRYTRSGDGFTLTADGETSHPFDISSAAYEQLRIDALSLYYPQRSGTPILGEIAGDEYARAAGHVSVPPNTGDVAVPCQTPEFSQTVYGEPWTCDYTLDVTGGWYDAGDHGKYVVNGGISVAQLMGTWERNQNTRFTDRHALGDSTLPLPERGNEVPDVLDEARWELEWMLAMQVPAGEPLAGMVHHKVHDHQWTGLPLDPAADDKVRELHRPSTAATLNLAAVAAQGSRIFEQYDAEFAGELLAAARRAWTAANATPALYAPAADGNSGGGPYDDSDVTDEFYWAAAELYVTTGEQLFKEAVLASPHHGPGQIPVEGFDWRTMAPLAQIDLATLPNGLPQRWQIRNWVLEGADAILALQDQQPWGQPYAPATNQWAWGSTAQILNNMVVLATAFDLTFENTYRDGVVEGMDFLLGRNALNISYVTGYGDVYAQNQHSRMYANQLNASLPNPPPGTIAGGPNSSIQDPVAQRLLQGCAPQFCYIDDIESWSTNELTINWNAALSWVASFVADQDDGGRRPQNAR